MDSNRGDRIYNNNNDNNTCLIMNKQKMLLQAAAQQGSLLNLLLERNSDIVEAGGYSAIATTGTALSFASGGRGFIFKNNLARIRQSGSITKVSFYYRQGNTTSLTELYIQIWRNIGTTYTLICEENILDRVIPASINVISLKNPFAVQEGDFVGITGVPATVGIEYSFAVNVTTAGSLYYYNGARITDDLNWDSETSLTYIVPIKVYMQAPMLVAIGDSIVSGANANTSFAQNAIEFTRASQITRQLELLDANYVCQNLGIGSQVSLWVKNRFTNDCVNIKPKIAYIHVGVNDIAIGTETKTGYLSNMQTMIEACIAAGIVPVVGKILPWTNGTNAQMQTRDDWMLDLRALVATYRGAIFVDFDETIGEFRTGGDAGNLWNIKAAYDDGDHVHLNESGYAAMATKINLEIKKKYRF